MTAPISNCESWQVIQNRKKQRKMAKTFAFYNTDQGQKELISMDADRTSRTREALGLSTLTEHASTGQISPMGNRNESDWVEIEMTADSGACDSVMPRDGPCASLQIFPSPQSERGMIYEVANKATIPCLGERRLEVWTEGAQMPRRMAIQVADVHKPLLSLSKCADSGYQSMFGQNAGALVDMESGDVIPLVRRGNLYYLRAWVRSAPNSSFGGPR